jgi:hypothetical protein
LHFDTFIIPPRQWQGKEGHAVVTTFFASNVSLASARLLKIAFSCPSIEVPNESRIPGSFSPFAPTVYKTV